MFLYQLSPLVDNSKLSWIQEQEKQLIHWTHTPQAKPSFTCAIASGGLSYSRCHSQAKCLLSYLDRYVLSTLNSRCGESKILLQSESLELGRTTISGLHVKEHQSPWNQDLLATHSSGEKSCKEEKWMQTNKLHVANTPHPAPSYPAKPDPKFEANSCLSTLLLGELPHHAGNSLPWLPCPSSASRFLHSPYDTLR